MPHHCRILKPILTFKAENADEVIDEVKNELGRILLDRQNFRCGFGSLFARFYHSKFVAYRVKDAIADYFMENTANALGKRQQPVGVQYPYNPQTCIAVARQFGPNRCTSAAIE